MNCPVCGGEMWDNREKKKNPKAPDYKCKNVECAAAGGVIWPEKGVKKVLVETNHAPIVPKANGSSTEMMRLSYRKDLMNNLITVYGSTPAFASGEIIEMFHAYWKVIEEKGTEQ